MNKNMGLRKFDDIMYNSIIIIDIRMPSFPVYDLNELIKLILVRGSGRNSYQSRMTSSGFAFSNVLTD